MRTPGPLTQANAGGGQTVQRVRGPGQPNEVYSATIPRTSAPSGSQMRTAEHSIR